MVPRQLDGRDGMFRCSAPNLCGAKHDLNAFRLWLKSYLVAGKMRTFEANRREAVRFLGWLCHVSNCALSSVSLSHAMAYQSFLGFIEAKYISTARVTRSDLRWRPFRGQLTPGSQIYALGVITQMSTVLLRAGYLTANAFAGVKPRPDSKAGITLDTSHTLVRKSYCWSRTHWKISLRWHHPTTVKTPMPEAQAQALARKTRLILRILLTTGMRQQELATTRPRDLDRAVMKGAEESVFKVVGKGPKERRIPVGQKLPDMVKAHQNDLRELHKEHQERLDAFNIEPLWVAALETPIHSTSWNITDDTILKR